MLGIKQQQDRVSPEAAISSLVVIITVVLVSLRGGNFLRSISVLFGLMAGWAIYYALGSGSPLTFGQVPIFDLPRPFAWGMPTFEIGVVMTNVIIGLILVANTIASVAAMGQTLRLQDQLNARIYSRATAVNGAANVLAAVGSSVGMVPHAAAAGLVGLTGVASRKPFILCCLMMMGLGFFPPLGQIVAAIPPPVGYAVYLTVFAQILIIGLKDLNRLPLDLRDSFVVGLTILIGVGVMALPPSALSELPPFLQYLAGNGLTVGIISCLLLEHLILPREKMGKLA
jgi:xanthine/uracil permease